MRHGVKIQVVLFSLILGAMAVFPLSAVSQDNEKSLKISGFTNKNIVENGQPNGPLTMVFESHSGSAFIAQKDIAASAEGQPMSGTVAIAEPDKESQEIVVLDLDAGKLSGTKYADVKLVIQSDGRNGRPLVGEGATYIIKINKEKVRLGDYFLSSSGAEQWVRVKMRGPSAPPEVDSDQVTVTKREETENL